MEQKPHTQLANLVDTSNPGEILNFVKRIFKSHYTSARFNHIKKLFYMVKRLFNGKFPGYKKCNTYYHDFNHTLDTLLASIRIIDGYNLKNETKLDSRMVKNLVVAALFHDVGYIQEDWDQEGTGAKFTKYHIQRSTGFLIRHADFLKIEKEDLEQINDFIHCTGLASEMLSIHFKSEEEKNAGAILGTADLLGQMSDRTYLEKLLFLYYEFKEAGIAGYNTEFDIIRKTIDFYEMTKAKLEDPFNSVYL